MPMDNREWLQRLREGNKAAVNDLKTICKNVHKGSSSLQDAEDLAQDTFIKWFCEKNWATLEKPKAWLYRVAANYRNDVISKEERNELHDPDELNELFDGAEKAEDYPPAADVYIEHAAKKYREEQLHKAIAVLSKENQKIVTLKLQELTYKEIGEEVGLEEGAVGARLSRLKSDLREIICGEISLEEFKENLRGFQLPSTVEQEIMRRIPKEIMRQIPNGSLNSAPTTSKPLVPWIIADSLAIGVALFIGLGIGQPVTFQPYSFDAPESAKKVELVEAPIVEKPPLKLSQVNQAGGLSGGESGNGNQANDSVQKTAADSQNDVESDKGNWTQTKGPYGGTITALHATPEGTLFAGTEVGIFRSTDGGETWVSASKGLRVYENNRLPSISTLTQKGNTLYAGTGGSLFSSTNGGDSWQQLTHLQRGRRISGVAIIGDTLYTGGFFQESVFFSDDNGKSWMQIDSGLTGQGGASLFASGTTLFAQMRGHVFRLKAGENSWTKLIIKYPWTKTTVGSDVTKFAVSDEIICAATTDGGLFRSTDMGDSWQSIKPQAMQHFYGELAVMGNTVFCIDPGSADGRVFRSNDAGDSWTMFNTNLTDQTIYSIATLSEKTFYVGTNDGVFRSTDGGESWTKINTGIVNTHNEILVSFGDALYTVTHDGIVKSADGGNSWGPVNDGLVASDEATLRFSRVYLPLTGWDGPKLKVSGDKLYVATSEGIHGKWNPGIYCLTDNGSSWIPIQRNMQYANGGIHIVSQLAITEETFYVVGAGQLYRWRVGEDLWTELKLEILESNKLAVLGRTVYIWSMDGRLFRSVDEGDTWSDMSRHLPNWKEQFALNDYDLAFVGETIYVGTSDDVFRSTDGGETWRSIAAGLPGGYIEIQIVDGTTIYGTSSHGIFRLAHGSDSWELIAPIQPIQHSIRSLAFDGTMFYAGTEAEGVFRLSLEE